VHHASNVDLKGSTLLGDTNGDSDQYGDCADDSGSERTSNNGSACISDGDSACYDSYGGCNSDNDADCISTGDKRNNDVRPSNVETQSMIQTPTTSISRLLSFGENIASSAHTLTDDLHAVPKATSATPTDAPSLAEAYKLLRRELDLHRLEVARLHAQIPPAGSSIATSAPVSAAPATSHNTPWVTPSLHQPDTMQSQLSSSPFTAQQVVFPFYPQTRRLHDHIDRLFETECGRFYERRLSMHFFLRLVYVFSQCKAVPCSTIQEYLYTSIVYQTYPTHFPGSFVVNEPSLRASMGVYLRHVTRSFVLAIPNPYDIMTVTFKAFIEPYDASTESLDVYITRVCTKLHTLTLVYDYVGLLEMFPQSKAASFVGNDILTRAFPSALQNINHDFTELQWSTFEGVSEYLLRLKEQPTFKLRAISFQTPPRPTPVADDVPLCKLFLLGRCRRQACVFSHDQTQQRHHTLRHERQHDYDERRPRATSDDYRNPSKRIGNDSYRRGNYHRDDHRRDDYRRDNDRSDDHRRDDRRDNFRRDNYRRGDRGRARPNDRGETRAYHTVRNEDATDGRSYPRPEHFVHADRRNHVRANTSTLTPVAAAAVTETSIDGINT